MPFSCPDFGAPKIGPKPLKSPGGAIFTRFRSGEAAQWLTGAKAGLLRPVWPAYLYAATLGGGFRFGQLLPVELLHGLLRREDRVEQRAVSPAAVFQRDGGALRADEPLFLQLTDIFRNGVAAHAHGLADGAVAGVALVGGAVFAVHEKGVHSDFAGGQAQPAKNFRQGVVVSGGRLPR